MPTPEELHERIHQNTLNFVRHEAVCQQRYEQLLITLDELRNDVKKMNKEVSDLRTIATTGRSTLKTILWLGSVAGAIIALFIAAANYFK